MIVHRLVLSSLKHVLEVMLCAWIGFVLKGWGVASMLAIAVPPKCFPFGHCEIRYISRNEEQPCISFDTSWNLYSTSSGAEQYLGNESQIVLSGPNSITSSEHSINVLAMASTTGNLYDAAYSTPMVKGKIIILYYWCNV